MVAGRMQVESAVSQWLQAKSSGKDWEAVMRTTEADVALRWKLAGGYLKLESATDGAYEQESQIVKFKSGDGLVGQCFAAQQPLFLHVGDGGEFLRQDMAEATGIRSIVFVPTDEDVVELGFKEKLSAGPGYLLDDHSAIVASIPGIDSIRAQVAAIKKAAGFEADVVDGPDAADKGNPDEWVPRNPKMNRLTGIHPFNCEAPLSILREHRFLTPATLHYVRNHGKCPALSWDTHTIEISGLVDRPIRLTMRELAALPTITLPVTLNCAGNRRKEQNLIKKGIGFHWGCAAVSTCVWTGVPLRAVLEHVGIQADAEWVNFESPKGEVPLGDGTYGASHHKSVCMNPARPCMLAFMMNGELLHPDHGYPVRLLMPGYIGGRMIKWVTKISVTKAEGENHYHIFDNRVFPKHITDKKVATDYKIWKDGAYTINDRNINSAIWTPAHCNKVSLAQETYTVSGYAYAGAGRPIHRVEVTVNGGVNWRPAVITRGEKPDQFGQCWCWVFWSVDVPTSVLAGTGEIAVRAWDDSQNCQPERPTWNLMGMMNNPWFRVKVHAVPGEQALWFEHPTRVEPNVNVAYPQQEHGGAMEALHMDGAAVASPGWMERLLPEVQAAYAPKTATGVEAEVADPAECWERGVAHLLPKPAEELAQPAPQPKAPPSCFAFLWR